MAEKYFPTKYDSAEHELIWDLATMYQWADDQTGHVDSPVGYCYRISISLEDVTMDGSEYGLAEEPLAKYGIKETEIPGHYLLTSNDQGFCYVARYGSKEALDQAWEMVQQQYSAWDDES